MPEQPITLERLLEVLHDELTRALQPLVESNQRLERQLGETYTREVADLKFAALQAQLDAVKERSTELERQVGGFWQNTLTRAAGWIGLGLALIELVKGLKLL